MNEAWVKQVSCVLNTVTRWVVRREDVKAVGLVGSWARNEARDDSDVDLTILTDTPDAYRAEDWLREIGLEIDSWKDADYGPLWSRHVTLVDGLEVEFGFSTPAWASLEPIDPGTRRVVVDGCHVLFDPERLLNKLKDALRD